MKAPVSDVNIGEAMAIVNAVANALKHGVILPGDEVLLQTDNNVVPRILGGERKSQDWIKVHLVFQTLAIKNKLQWRWRHVKGHKGTIEPRNAVNTYCDGIAKQHLQAERLRRTESRET